MREIATALDGHVDYLLCATGTCGTLRGCVEYVRELGLSTRVVAVDAVGSVIFGTPARPRLIPGHGAGVRPALLEDDLADQVIHIDDLVCVMGCRRLLRREGILAGGSSGAVVAALDGLADRIPASARCAQVFPDRGERYLETVYNGAWVAARLGPAGAGAVSVLGCGALARAHLELVVRYLPAVTTAYVFDLVPERAKALVAWAAEALPGLDVRITGSARECAGAGTQVITLTVSDTPYATIDWFRPGTFVAHVSLDDLRADVFGGAEAVYVDDVELVRENPRRILGRLMREGLIAERGTVPGPGGRALAGTLGEILLGRVEPRRPTDGVVVSNPFGMSVLDVGLVSAVHAVAVAEGLGTRLD